MNLESTSEERHWVVRLFVAAAKRFRPQMGWVALASALLLLLLPAVAIREAAWINLRRVQVTLEWVCVFSLFSGWWFVSALRSWSDRIVAWQRSRRSTWSEAMPLRARLLRQAYFAACALGLLLWLLLGAMTVSQVLVHWIPGPVDVWRAFSFGDLPTLLEGVEADLSSLVWRFQDWISGVQAGGAYQDDFVFLSLFGVLFWLLGGATALLTLATRNGLIVGAPILWVLATFLFYGRQGRTLILIAFVTTLFLHVLLDQQRLEKAWARSRTDFGSMLVLDRLLSVGAAFVLIVILGAFMPNVVIRPLANSLYQTMTPVYDSVDDVTERMFPDLKGGRRGMGRLSSGLPNRFLLEGGTELGRFEVMRVSTNYPFGEVTELGDAPPRLYMRRGTFANYDGRGWNNANNARDARFEAHRAWRSDEEWPGRVELIQRVRLTAPTSVLPAAGEPSEFRIDYELERRSPDDLVAIWSDTGPVDRFEAISFVPAMSADSLRDLPDWDESELPLPSDMALHLRLPESVTPRLRNLAEQLANDQADAFSIAESIEAYLRQITYNLGVPAPPPGSDVADFFLFDLQEGYCDYYTTAFAVLARLNGLPTRFATGYIGGYWELETGEWTITEAEAHSWPEVYFPQIGWVPFEPTAGRPSLQRQQLFGATPSRSFTSPAASSTPAPSEEDWNWSWQTLFWLLPLAAALYAFLRWLERRPQDPWSGLLAWGRRIGRTQNVTETELEYGQGLSRHLVDHEREPERRRRLTRNVAGLTQAVSQERYGTQLLRASALERADQLWKAMRRDIRRLPW